MSAVRLAVVSLAVASLFCSQPSLIAGDGLPPVPTIYVDSVQKVAPLAAQKVQILPTQKHEAFPLQSHAFQKHVAPLPIKGGCCQPKIVYRHHRCCKRRGCCSCQSPAQIVLPVADPDCCHKLHYIPVPAPSCCLGIPWEKARGGLFCRGVHVFKWPGGYMVKVVFLKKGDVIVHTFGVPVQTPVAPAGIPVQHHPVQPYPVAPSVYSPAPTPALRPEITPVLPPADSGPELVPPGGYAF